MKNEYRYYVIIPPVIQEKFSICEEGNELWWENF